MSNVAVASDSLQMSQQLARSSQQRGWQGGFESRGSVRECVREGVCVCVCVCVGVCVFAHIVRYGCTTLTVCHCIIRHGRAAADRDHTRLLQYPKRPAPRETPEAVSV